MKKIFYNGEILTLEDNLYVEAIFIENGIIKDVGSNEDILKRKDDTTELINLEGKFMMPSFIDSHSHITSFAKSLGLTDLSKCKNFKDIVDTLKKFKKTNQLKDNDWIYGFGYDNNILQEKCHPNKENLDEVSLDNPILIAHKSGHMGVANSKALELMEIDDNTPDPEGGLIGKTDNKVNGYLEESAFINRTQNMREDSPSKTIELINKAEDIYLSYGITTAQDGLSKEKEFNLLKEMSNDNKLKLDIVSYIDINEDGNLIKNNKKYLKKYKNNLKIGGYKLFLDGSPQGKTAWLSTPYEGEKEYRGYARYTDSEVLNFVKKSLDEDMQLITHCNGDAACEQLISTFEKINNKENNRPVIIHAQTLQTNQLPRVKKLGMIPSYFIAHVYYWGDIHIKNLGSRAYKISPIKSTIDNGIMYTMHQDTPVILPNMFETIWCAVKRETQNKVILGNDEKISVLDAIKGITINAAYQYFEENQKGTIKIGKNADLIIVNKNPLKIDIDEIKSLKILETIKKGEVLYNLSCGKN